MTFDEILAHCLSKPGAWQDEPWENDIVAKVDVKIFCFLGDRSVGLKCGDRDEADTWLEQYPDDASVMPYIGRSGWNTLKVGTAIPDSVIRDAIDDSYLFVVSKLPKKRRPDGWEAA